MAASAERYTRVAVVIHWLMAAAIIAMLVMGFAMQNTFGEIDPMLRFNMFQWHKATGIILLWLIALRLLWRLTHRPPEASRIYPKWERLAATAAHFFLYLLMIALPVTGWLIVSSSPTGIPTSIFGLFTWPHMPGIEPDAAANETYEARHGLFAYILIGVIALHIGAVVKHWVIDRENILPRMWFPPRKKPEKIDA